MRKVVIIAGSKPLAKLLQRVVTLYCPPLPVMNEHATGLNSDAFVLPRRGPLERMDPTPTRAFELLVEWISGHLVWTPEADDRLYVVVDRVRVDRLNPLHPADTFDATIAMLILAFPEVHWIFARTDAPEAWGSDRVNNVPRRSPNRTWRRRVASTSTAQEWLSNVKRLHSMQALAAPTIEPLFDPSGLRELVKENARSTAGDPTSSTPHATSNSVAPFLPARFRVAASLDDEIGYAYLSSYTAYRFGFRSIPVYRWRLADWLWGKSRQHTKSIPQILPAGKNAGGPEPLTVDITFEDLYVDLPDVTDNRIHLSRLDLSGGRRDHLPGLYTRGIRRTLVTSGHEAAHAEVSRSNRSFLESARMREVRKPFEGLFDLWHETFRRHEPPVRWSSRWFDKHFHWPPQDPFVAEGLQTTGTGHSPPGRLNLVASTLVRRARACWDAGALTAPAATRGAVLAGLALELYGCKVPAACVDAILLKHRFEVTVECYFSGVEYNIDVEMRLQELRRELEAVFFRDSSHCRTANVDNATMLVVGAITQILSSHEQFEEERLLRKEMLSLHHRLSPLRRHYRSARGYAFGGRFGGWLHRVAAGALGLWRSTRDALERMVWRAILLFADVLRRCPDSIKRVVTGAAVVLGIPFAGGLALFQKYLETVSNSAKALLGWSVVWLLVLGSLVAGGRTNERMKAAIGSLGAKLHERAVDVEFDKPWLSDFLDACNSAFNWLTGVEIKAHDWWTVTVATTATAIGLVHLGLLVSIIYSRLSRK